MKKRITFFRQKTMMALLLLTAWSFSLQAQQQSRLWSFPPNYIKYNPAPTPQIPLPQQTNTGDYQGQAPAFSHNAAHAPNGDLLFFVVDGTIYDKYGQLIAQTGIKGSTECLVVPVPNQCEQWIIVAADVVDAVTPDNAHLYYTVITFTNSQFYTSGGTNVITPPQPSMSYNNAPHLAVSDLRSDNTRLMYMHWGGKLHKYRIHDDVANTPPYYDGIVAATPDHLTTSLRSEMELIRLSDQTYRIAYPYLHATDFKYHIAVLRLDASGSTVMSSSDFAMPGSGTGSNADLPKGLEFSPNGQFLYFTHTGVNPIQFIDLATNTVDISLSSVSAASQYQLTQIERVFDNDDALFFAGPNFISALRFPNTPFVTNWVPNYNNNNIAVPITHNFTDNYSANQSIRMLVDQRDGEDYTASFNTSPECCLVSTTFKVDNYTAGTAIQYITPSSFNYTATTQTWTPTNNPFGGTTSTPISTVSVRGKITIPAGYNITIRGMRFEFASRTGTIPGGSVIVERSTSSVAGARLTLDKDNATNTSTVFTSYNSCGNGMWEGIEVRGFSNQAQGNILSGKQAWLNVRNGTLIENAYHAVVMAKVNNTFTSASNPLPVVDGTQSGGVIQASRGSRFINNKIDVYFPQYDFPSTVLDNNLSVFNNCTFETTNALNDPNIGLPIHHMLNGVKGISYVGNTFKCSDLVNYDILQNTTGLGIYSINSAFTVTPVCITLNCSTIDRNVFENLTYGIIDLNFLSTKTVTVDRSDFINNYRGILLSSVDRATITRNNFSVYPWPTSMANEAYGLYLNFSKGFKVTENDFSSTTPSSNTFGVIVNQSNPNRYCGQGDEIYKNTFHDLLVGGRAQGANSEKDAPNNTCYPGAPGTPNNVGLVFKCNTFYNTVVQSDLSVTNSGAVKGNIAFQQGYPSFTDNTPAGNTFSHTPGGFDFFSAAYPNLVDGDFQYTHHTDAARTPLTFVQPPVIPVPCSTCGTFNSTTSCPTQFVSGQTTQTKRLAIGELKEQISTIEQTLAEGDAQTLLNLVANGTSGQIKNGLLAESPYLSDRVLIAAVNKNLPAGVLKEIILANSPVEQYVMEVLNGKSLPNGIRNEINNAQTGISERTKLIIQLSAYVSEKNYEINELLRIFLNDTTIVNGLDSVIEIFKTENIQEAKCELTKAYIAKGDIVKAIETVDELRADPTMNNFCKLADVLIQLYGSTNRCYGLSFDPVARQKVEEVALEYDKRECADANAWLRIAFGYLFQEVIEPVTLPVNLRLAGEETSVLNINKQGKLYPNPNNGSMSFAYNLAEGQKGVLTIYDATGRVIGNFMLEAGENVMQINEEGLNNGLYFYQYSVNGKTILSDKLIIIK